jgi:hypothetical protein
MLLCYEATYINADIHSGPFRPLILSGGNVVRRAMAPFSIFPALKGFSPHCVILDARMHVEEKIVSGL